MPLPGNCTPSRHIATSLNVELCLATAKATFLARIVSLLRFARGFPTNDIAFSLSLSLALVISNAKLHRSMSLEIGFDSEKGKFSRSLARNERMKMFNFRLRIDL